MSKIVRVDLRQSARDSSLISSIDEPKWLTSALDFLLHIYGYPFDREKDVELFNHAFLRFHQDLRFIKRGPGKRLSLLPKPFVTTRSERG